MTNPAAKRPPWRPVPSSPRRSSGDPRCAWIRVDPTIPRRAGGPARGARRRSPPMAQAALEMRDAQRKRSSSSSRDPGSVQIAVIILHQQSHGVLVGAAYKPVWMYLVGSCNSLPIG